jgi:hypothetical protein
LQPNDQPPGLVMLQLPIARYGVVSYRRNRESFIVPSFVRKHGRFSEPDGVLLAASAINGVCRPSAWLRCG